ncbi:hypothetical protein BT96DRAFT_1009966 [Gymnopus androsaceus JB14]|uniref:Uncharacterized protein n=1 Tax=Gymnopus androsaceus JB14 TaxID=1447944 RepID=A0A6A4GBS4_9AGAR|nr:hypothetical protein BT96DRAFT_1009966 [Gymnopus androsaceus JB14]
MALQSEGLIKTIALVFQDLTPSPSRPGYHHSSALGPRTAVSPKARTIIQHSAQTACSQSSLLGPSAPGQYSPSMIELADISRQIAELLPSHPSASSLQDAIDALGTTFAHRLDELDARSKRQSEILERILAMVADRQGTELDLQQGTTDPQCRKRPRTLDNNDDEPTATRPRFDHSSLRVAASGSQRWSRWGFSNRRLPRSTTKPPRLPEQFASLPLSFSSECSGIIGPAYSQDGSAVFSSSLALSTATSDPDSCGPASSRSIKLRFGPREWKDNHPVFYQARVDLQLNGPTSNLYGSIVHAERDDWDSQFVILSFESVAAADQVMKAWNNVQRNSPYDSMLMEVV